jgi:hypothetical protein
VEETLPAAADQVTAVLLVPVTVAVNWRVPPVNSEAEAGEIDTATGALTPTATGALTATAAEADLVVSALLVAVTT